MFSHSPLLSKSSSKSGGHPASEEPKVSQGRILPLHFCFKFPFRVPGYLLLYHSILYYTLLYFTILYYTVLHYTLLSFRIFLQAVSIASHIMSDARIGVDVQWNCTVVIANSDVRQASEDCKKKRKMQYLSIVSICGFEACCPGTLHVELDGQWAGGGDSDRCLSG